MGEKTHIPRFRPDSAFLPRSQPPHRAYHNNHWSAASGATIKNERRFARRSYHSNLFKFALFFPRPVTRTVTVAGRAKRFIELASAGASRGLASEKNASPAAED